MPYVDPLKRKEYNRKKQLEYLRQKKAGIPSAQEKKRLEFLERYPQWKELDIFSEKEFEVLIALYGSENEAPTLEEVGTRMGVSREYVRQLRNKAIKKLEANHEQEKS